VTEQYCTVNEETEKITTVVIIGVEEISVILIGIIATTTKTTF